MVEAVIRRTKTGERFVVVEYCPIQQNWGGAMTEARRQLGDAAFGLPFVAVVKNGRMVNGIDADAGFRQNLKTHPTEGERAR